MVVYVLTTGNEAGWRAANNKSFRDFADANAIDLEFQFANNSRANQLATLYAYSQDRKVNVVVLAAAEFTGYDDALRALQKAGKVVILEDRPLDVDPSLYYAYVGSDYQLEGQKAALAMCTLLGNSTSKHVAVIQGDATIAEAAVNGRIQGFSEHLGDCGMTITASDTAAGWDPEKAYSIMKGFLAKSKDIQGVFAHNDQLAIGAIRAIEEAGLGPGVDIQVVGVDASADGFKYLISGELGADIECSPLLGPPALAAALDALNGKTNPKRIFVSESWFFAAQGADALKAILAQREY
jgi:ABC-type sugar transport system substrate-binding protein